MSAIVLDISRSVARVNKGHETGIDRVELAYIKHYLDKGGPVFFLARFLRRSILLDRTGMSALWKVIKGGGPWPDRTSFDRLTHTTKVEKAARKFAPSHTSLKRSLASVPAGFTYLNVGHGRFRQNLWPILRQSGAARIIAMIHDVIPLDYPEFCRPDTAQPFRDNLQALAKNADIFLYNSGDTQTRTEAWMTKWGESVTGHVVPLGTTPLPVGTGKVPKRPYFVCLGTIEPRKNHRLLLDIWAELHATLPEDTIPHLHIIGRRGWLNEDVFHDLDTANYMNHTVFEHSELSDLEVGSRLANATALLFPSFAEGFGYPLVEALQLNVPTICSDLASFREIGNNTPNYLNPRDQTAWVSLIVRTTTLNRCAGSISENLIKIPTWQHHLHNIDTIISDKLTCT